MKKFKLKPKSQDLFAKIILGFVSIMFMLIFLFILLHIVSESSFSIKTLGASLVDPKGSWRPLSENPQYSILPMLLTTLSISALSVLFALPLGMATAFLIVFYVKPSIASLLLSFINLIAGIPSIIFGFIGLTVFMKPFEYIFSMSSGESLLLGALVLAIMLLPFIVSTYYDTLLSLKQTYYNAGLAMGYRKEYIFISIIAKLLGTSTLRAILLAFGRAMGETMAVMMVIGNAPLYPTLFGRVMTIPSLTALEISSAEYASLHLSAIYTANLILLILLAFLLIVAHQIQKKVACYEKNR